MKRLHLALPLVVGLGACQPAPSDDKAEPPPPAKREGQSGLPGNFWVGDEIVVKFQNIPGTGCSVMSDGPSDETAVVYMIPIGSVGTIVPKEDDVMTADGDWITVRFGPGIARNPDGSLIGQTVVGVMHAHDLGLANQAP